MLLRLRLMDIGGTFEGKDIVFSGYAPTIDDCKESAIERKQMLERDKLAGKTVFNEPI